MKQMSSPSKDQSQTIQALLDLREVVENWPSSPFAEAAKQMIREAESHLAEAEYRIGKFYMKRKAFLAAASPPSFM